VIGSGPVNVKTTTTGSGVIDEIGEGDLRVKILRKGAEMVSVARDGRGFLYRDGETSAPASGWGNHATVMGYFLHRLWKEESSYRGSVIRGGNHGFLRHFDFAEPVRLEDGLRYSLRADEIPPGAYPLRVSCALTYRLVGGSVHVEFEFKNEEPSLEAHVSFGLHPGFAVGSLADARVILPAGRYVRHFAPGNFLDGRTEVRDFQGGEMPYPRAELAGSYLLGIEAVPERTIVLESPACGSRVSLDFREVPYMTLWSDSDAFICIEPCWGLPDSNPPVVFEAKAGIQKIPAGGSLRRGFSFQPGFLS